jgi:3'-phosphoadenosine 5'-phosphosulfate sulfotransferase (PAPS reductase)/FAD synthetase
MEDHIKESLAIYQKAVAELQPTHTVVMFSGGDDSLTTLQLAKTLKIPVDYIIHGNTRTGLPETTEFVRQTAKDSGIPYLEADAGSSYEDYVNRKGFFGSGQQAHNFSYHVLKATWLRRAISHNIRKRKRNVRVLCLSGIRLDESANRAEQYKDGFWNVDPSATNNIWLRPIQHRSKEDCLDLIHDEAECLGRSGECMCGTMQNQAARMEAAKFSPNWGKWLDALEKKVVQRFPWRWGESQPKTWNLERHGQGNLFTGFNPDFQPACVGCKAKANRSPKSVLYEEVQE